ncbi:MAG: hypothetical protein ACR2N9_05095 [Acidimicrobiia bacterium]
MNLSPGEAWGDVEVLPANAPVVVSDAELVACIGPDIGVTTATDLPIVGLAGGDLCASLGGRGDVADRRGAPTTVVTIDVASVSTDAGDHVFAAHLFARGWFWAGEGVAVMNAERCSSWLVAPRAHPGDGLLDVVQGRLSVRDRLLARQRLRTGDHLPHPALAVRRTARLDLEFDRPRRVVVDGIAHGTSQRLLIEVLPNAVRVAV